MLFLDLLHDIAICATHILGKILDLRFLRHEFIAELLESLRVTQVFSLVLWHNSFHQEDSPCSHKAKSSNQQRQRKKWEKQRNNKVILISEVVVNLLELIYLQTSR